MPKRENRTAQFSPLLDFQLKKADVIRLKIIDGVIEIIGKEGSEGITFEKVGKRVGMQRSHVAYYFPDRETMIQAAIRFTMASGQRCTQEVVSQATTPEERILTVVRGACHWLRRHPKQGALLLLLFHYASYDKFYKEMHSHLREVGAQRILSQLQLISPKKKSTDLYPVAKEIQNIVTGTVIDWLATDTGTSIDDLERSLTQTVLKFVKGRL